jgi:hypothetical protein
VKDEIIENANQNIVIRFVDIYNGMSVYDTSNAEDFKTVITILATTVNMTNIVYIHLLIVISSNFNFLLHEQLSDSIL